MPAATASARAAGESTPPLPRAVVGVVFPGNARAATTWSGTPAGLVRALEEAGIDVAPIHAEPPLALDFLTRNAVAALHLHRARQGGAAETIRLARRIARVTPQLGALYTRAARRELERAGRVDGAIQIGTGYVLPTHVRAVTLEDLTIPQAVRSGYPEWTALPKRTLRACIERQGRAYRQAVACCMTTRWAADSVVEDYGVPREKVHAVGVGRNHDPRPVVRDWTRPTFLFVGKRWESKNGPGVLHAFAALRREIPEARLDVVGDHPRIEADGVWAHGHLRLDDPDDRRRIQELYETATCFLLPSWYEASAIAYVEAAAAGLPSIGTTVGGSRDLIGAGGRVVDPGDDAALLAAMRELTNPATAARVGELARQRSKLFTWRLVAERILRALALPGVPDSSLADFL